MKKTLIGIACIAAILSHAIARTNRTIKDREQNILNREKTNSQDRN